MSLRSGSEPSLRLTSVPPLNFLLGIGNSERKRERERERESVWSNPIQAGRKRQAAGNMGATEIVGRGWFFRMARRARKRMREAPQAKSNKSIQFKNPEILRSRQGLPLRDSLWTGWEIAKEVTKISQNPGRRSASRARAGKIE